MGIVRLPGLFDIPAVLNERTRRLRTQECN
jgi:hypothetical protein